ncbi:IS66 family insertion sequence element accessory protein TnpA [Desulforhabdus amnigena]|uniref:Transposase n=1 Tax=Desulforhabdus amnigena TaxID=40218 RepID=A0A9W6FTH1_9BACT|nr:hypothetical protein [Desulforhabdus amnigena]NLJ27811.1 hypothetical protein [Deltaproteobacteria bacterium]GLI33261.1 hypothetical protein DAMNIGENAA_06940 [Desulforhabdus amnigena]
MEKKPRLEENEEKRRFWEEHLKRWETSGMTQNEYCRQNRLKVNRFIYWKKKCPQKSTVSLVEWSGTKEEKSSVVASGGPLCVVVGGRYRIEIGQGFDPGLLDGVVRVLRSL